MWGLGFGLFLAIDHPLFGRAAQKREKVLLEVCPCPAIILAWVGGGCGG